MLLLLNSARYHVTTKRTSLRPMLSAIEEMQLIHFLTLKNVLQINNDNRDISNNDINKKHNEYKLGSGEEPLRENN